MKIRLGNKAMVSDPCYGLNTWCQGILENVLPGIYNCTVEYSDTGDWGERVSAIEVTHTDCGIYRYERENFVVGVDSGQAGIFDYEYYCQYHTDYNDRNHVDDDWYGRVCDITLARESAGIIDECGFVSSSGYGDGAYGCWVAKNRDDYIVAIRIEYIIEEDEEEDEWDDDEEYEGEDDEQCN
jgi:hypothetical protein